MQVSDLHELDQIRHVEQKKDRPKDRSLWHSIQYVRLNGCGASTANELVPSSADGREGRTRTSSEQCRESRTMSRVVVVVFRGRQYQKPQIDRAATI